MILKNIIAEDFTNYHKASMFLIFPYCDFKCDKERGIKICQNSSLSQSANIKISVDSIIEKYLNNTITKAIVCGGLEPMDSFNDLFEFVSKLRTTYKCDDDIIIYTGYYKEEILDKIANLKNFNNIIIKFGRYIPNQKPHFDPILKIELASNNQYAERIS